jgi:biopolymer transport protein ExbB
MSFGSFFILFTKFFEQSKILGQYKALANFWRAPALREGAAKLDKNSAWRQLVDDGLAAEDQHAKMTDALEAHDWLHGSLARSEAAINARWPAACPSSPPWVPPRRSSVCSVPWSASTAP